MCESGTEGEGLGISPTHFSSTINYHQPAGRPARYIQCFHTDGAEHIVSWPDVHSLPAWIGCEAIQCAHIENQAFEHARGMVWSGVEPAYF